MLIKDILNINDAKLIQGNLNAPLTNFSIDTRTINENETYLGIKGEKYNGSLFYEEALKKKAATCILSDVQLDETILKKYPHANIITVSNTRLFLKELAIKKRASLKIPIIAITGSVGKTSTKNIIASTLATTYKVKKTAGNLNTDIGLCLTILSLKDEEFLVLEMGMDKFGEIRELTNIAKPDVAVITNIGTAHIGNLGSRENILKAKLEIIEGLNGPLIINNDNDLLHAWFKNHKITQPLITYGIDNSSDYQATNLNYDAKGSHFQVLDSSVTLNVLGKHFIYNSLVAFAIAKLYNIAPSKVISALKEIKTEVNRMQLITNKYTIINDTYNASYDSIYYALEVLSFFKGRKIAVLGDILELGTYSENIHRQIGKLILNFHIDYLITVGKDSEYINNEALHLGFNKSNSYHFTSNKEALNIINTIIAPKDTILIKASHSMNFIEIVEGLKEN